ENSKIFTTNQTVNIWVKDKAGNIIKQTILISKIDTLAPSNVILTKGSVTSSSITVTASATQSNMGIRGYQFSIDGGAYSTEQTSVSKTFTGLAKNTSHTFKVKVIGKNGKSTESSVITVSTNNITTPTYSVNSSADTWAQSKTVTITYPGTKTSNLVYEYSKDGGTTWTNVTSSSTTVTFTSNGSVIARIRDTGNSNNTVTGSTLTVTKIDTTKPSITGTKDITLAKGQSYNLLTGVTATDSESGVKSLTTSITNTTSLAVGTYTITYTAIDNASNQLTKTSTLQIVESTYNYGYTGTYKTFIVPYDGTYRFELWGAAGGGASGGHGAYTKGKIILTKGETLYIYVGQHREHQDVQAAYNGGGSSQPEKGIDGYENRYNSGGGATDIRLVSGAWDNFNSLKSRIMVASGGGGGFYRPGQTILGGAGGNLTGASGIKSTGEGSEKVTVATGGTQTSGGKGGIGEHTSGDAGSFGKGASVPSTKKFLAGGGGGYYGGGSSGVSTQIASTGGGGSSFISGFTGCNAIASNSTETNIIHTGQPNHYSGKVFEGILMYNGSQEMPNPRGSGTIIGNGNHGYARVTILSIQN
ncbi:MAG: DUF5011 domain-containing protein, partial [Firmicutes bacterium]|nr:DUF5011 domain-containing protein [Bacillota bacterium]